jgi:N-acetylmuramoyl-L-alanine amidase
MVAELAVAAALVCIDPGHGTDPAVGGQHEPIGPGSAQLKIKDGGGAAGESAITLQLARRTRALLLERGYRVVMTRSAPGYRGGNVDRARFCNERGAALMLRIHADGSTDTTRHGVATLYPAYRRGWTDDVYAASRRAARLVQTALVAATGATDLGIVRRSDLTGFNWADVPVILVETGFLSNPAESRRLHSAGYQAKIAGGLAKGVAAFVSP